jgi:hypothetical protein
VDAAKALVFLQSGFVSKTLRTHVSVPGGSTLSKKIDWFVVPLNPEASYTNEPVMPSPNPEEFDSSEH